MVWAVRAVWAVGERRVALSTDWMVQFHQVLTMSLCMCSYAWPRTCVPAKKNEAPVSLLLKFRCDGCEGSKRGTMDEWPGRYCRGCWSVVNSLSIRCWSVVGPPKVARLKIYMRTDLELFDVLFCTCRVPFYQNRTLIRCFDKNPLILR